MADRIEFLDTIRACAIIPVVVVHYYSPWLPGGGLGVSVFFALSGYFVTGLLMRDLPPRELYLSFLVRRMMRILPLYYAVLTLALVCLWFSTPAKLANIRLSDLYLMLATPAWSGYATGVLWTLHVEFWFYLVFPLIFISFRRKWLILGLVAAGSVSAILWPGFSAFTQMFPASIKNFIFFANNFAFGAAAFLIVRKFQDSPPPVPRWLWALLACVCIVGIGAAYALVRHTMPGIPNPLRIFGALVAAMTAVLIVACSLGRLSVWVPGLSTIALVSYSMYLVHGLILDHAFTGSPFGQYLEQISVGTALRRLPTWDAFARYFVACLALSAVAHFALERPSIMAGRYLANNRRRRVATS